MNRLMSTFRSGSHTLSLVLGLGVITLAAATLFSRLSVQEVVLQVQQLFGVTFLLLLSSLVFFSLFSWMRLRQANTAASQATWLEAGLQAANGITTLALTYTLLGISLGIGSLADQALTPQSVQPIIRTLTENFSMAFLTTVVGLPLSAVFRALLLVTDARISERYSIENKETYHEVSTV